MIFGVDGAPRPTHRAVSSSSSESVSSSSSEEMGAVAVNEKSHVKFPELHFNQHEETHRTKEKFSDENMDTRPSELSDSFGGGEKSSRSVESNDPSPGDGDSDQDKAVRAVSAALGGANARFPTQALRFTSSTIRQLSKTANQKQERWIQSQSNVTGPAGVSGSVRVALTKSLKQPVVQGNGAQFRVNSSSLTALPTHNTIVPVQGTPSSSAYSSPAASGNPDHPTDTNWKNEIGHTNGKATTSMFGRSLFPPIAVETPANSTELLAAAPSTSALNLDSNNVEMILEPDAKLLPQEIVIPPAAQLPSAPMAIETLAERAPIEIAIEPFAEPPPAPIAIEPFAEPPPKEIAIETFAEPPPKEIAIEPFAEPPLTPIAIKTFAEPPPEEIAVEPSAEPPPTEITVESFAEPPQTPIAIEPYAELQSKPIFMESPAEQVEELVLDPSATSFDPFKILFVPQALHTSPSTAIKAYESQRIEPWSLNEANSGIATPLPTSAEQYGPGLETILKELLRALRHAFAMTTGQSSVLKPIGRSGKMPLSLPAEPPDVHNAGVRIRVNDNEAQNVPATEKLYSVMQKLVVAVQQRQSVSPKVAAGPFVVIRMEPVNFKSTNSQHASSTELAPSADSPLDQYPPAQRAVIRIRTPTGFGLELHGNSNSSLWKYVQRMLQAVRLQSSNKYSASPRSTAAPKAAGLLKTHLKPELEPTPAIPKGKPVTWVPLNTNSKTQPKIGQNSRVRTSKTPNSNPAAVGRSFIKSHGLGTNGAMILVPLTERPIALPSDDSRSNLRNFHESYVYKERF